MSPLCRRTVLGRGCRGLGVGSKRSHRARSSPRRGALGPSCPMPTGIAHSIIECPARPRAIWVEGKNSYYREAGPRQLQVLGRTALGCVCGSWGQWSRTASVTRNRAVRINLRLGLKQMTTVLACHSMPNRGSCC